MATMTIEGRRCWITTRYGEPCVEPLKALGCHWDRERKAWWISSGKAADVERILTDSGAAFDLRKADDRAVRADQLEDAGDVKAAEELRKGPPKEDSRNVRLIGKATYKGRTYYVRAISADGRRCRLVTLDQALDFWADAGDGEAQARVVKRYEPREVWDGRRNSGRTRTEYTTLHSIQKFIEKQNDSSTRRGRCTECDHWGPVGETCTECHEGTHQ